MKKLATSLIRIGSTVSLIGLAALAIGYLSLLILIPFREDLAGVLPLIGITDFLFGAAIAFVGVLMERIYDKEQDYDTYDHKRHTK